MEKKAITPLTVAFWVLVFVMIWFLFLGKFLNMGVGMAIENGNLTGIEALILANLNLLVFICMIIFIIAYGYLTG
jgi:hypothetical protein